MALIPLLFDDWLHPAESTSRNIMSIFHHPEEIIAPSAVKSVLNQLASLEKDQSIQIDKNQFQATIDVQQFKPEEITVKLDGDNTVIVEGKHEEQQDEHGYISRHFVRRYVLPEDCDAAKVQSKLSSDGVLSISAPKRPEGKQNRTKEIPISLTGPIKRTEQKSDPKEQAQKKIKA